MKSNWQRRISWFLAGVMLFGPGSLSWGDDGFWSKAKARITGHGTAAQLTYVERLAMCIDRLERELQVDGTVVAKAPDVWGEARLTNHRAEFEEQFAEKVSEFEVRLNGSIDRSDQAFLANAFMLSASLSGPGSGGGSPPAISASQINNVLPGVQATDLDGKGVDGKGAAPSPINMYVSKPGGLAGLGDFGNGTEKIRLDQTIELDQMARYLNHLHEIRRMNEGDDTADSPGYSLNLVRIPISIMPGSRTRKGHAAEITVTAESHVTEELLPTTFRALVINDLVDQLTVPVVAKIQGKERLNERLEQAYLRTKDALRYTMESWPEEFAPVRSIFGDLEWFTLDGFKGIVDSLNQDPGPARVQTYLVELRDSISQGEKKRVETFRKCLPWVEAAFSRHFPEKADELQAKFFAAVLTSEAKTRTLPIPDSLRLGFRLEDVQPQQENPLNELMQRATETYNINTNDDIQQIKQLSREGAIRGFIGKPDNKQKNRFPEEVIGVLSPLLKEYDSLSEAIGTLTSAASHRRARSPLTASSLTSLFGSDLDLIARNVKPFVDHDSLRMVSSVRNVLRDELENAYEAVFAKELTESLSWIQPELIVNEIVAGELSTELRGQIHESLCGSDRASMRSLLTWPVLVESLLLSRQLNADIRHVSRDPECQCTPPAADIAFYGAKPSAEARRAFVDYVKCRWPVHVFALDPVVQDQNVADTYAMRRELQLAMSIAVASGKVSAQNASRYARRLEMDMETVALNRTAVAFGHGKDTFGWKFTPRVQTPDFEGNARVVLRDLLIGGPNRDDLRNKWELEPGMRECVAVVLMPSFVTHVRFDCRGQFMPMACDRLGVKTPADTRTSVSDTVEMSRLIREMQHCAMHAMRESHLYRDGEVERLMRRVEQLSDRLPLQTCYSRVPNENTLGGFEMFSSGVTDLAPELHDWFGEPGYSAGEETTVFLIGSNFSVTGTRVIIGNQAVRPRLLSREVMEVTIPSDVQVSEDLRDGKEGKFVDIHVATPYGVSQHIHVPVDSTAEAPQLAWGSEQQQVIYRWNRTGANAALTWEVQDDSILLPRPQEISVRLTEQIAGSLHVPATATLNLTIWLEMKGSSYALHTQVYPDIKYAPGRKSFVLDGATLMTFHKELRTKLLAKLKAAGHAQDPPESVSLEIEGFLTPSGGANPRVEIPGKSLLNIEFQDQNQ